MTSRDADRDQMAAALAAEAEHGLDDEQIGDARMPAGRPALPDGDARSEQIVVRVTPADKARLVWLADFTSQAQSDLARRALDDLFGRHGIKEVPDPDDHSAGSTSRPGASVHLLEELVGSKAFTEAVAEQVRRELEQREQPA